MYPLAVERAELLCTGSESPSAYVFVLSGFGFRLMHEVSPNNRMIEQVKRNDIMCDRFIVILQVVR